jgi:RNA polymerase sigma factor (sigma-70 family)
LAAIQTEIVAERGTGDLAKRAATLLTQAPQGRAADETRQHDQQRLETFRARRRDALFQESHCTGLDLPYDPQTVATTARAALAVFAAPDTPWDFARRLIRRTCLCSSPTAMARSPVLGPWSPIITTAVGFGQNMLTQSSLGGSLGDWDEQAAKSPGEFHTPVLPLQDALPEPMILSEPSALRRWGDQTTISIRAATQRKVASMGKSPDKDKGKDKDTSLTLMMRVQQNPADPQAWDQFVKRYEPMIRGWCLKWGAQASDADDLAQQVLLKSLTAMKSYRRDPAASFRGWLKAVTHNAWRDFVRPPRTGQGMASPDAIADSSDALADLEKEMQQAFERELLELAMKRVEERVKPKTWEAFRLTSIENLPGADAAKTLDMPVSSVFVAKHRVMKLLEEEVRKLKGGREWREAVRFVSYCFDRVHKRRCADITEPELALIVGVPVKNGPEPTWFRCSLRVT